MRAQVYPALDGWRWRLRSTKGKTVAESGRAFVKVEDCSRALHVLPYDIAASEPHVRQSGDGWRWQVRDDAGHIVAESPKPFVTRLTCRIGFSRFVKRFNRIHQHGLHFAGMQMGR